MKIAPKQKRKKKERRSREPSVTKNVTDGKKRVLVIDDYIVIRKNHRILLERMGFEVFEALNGNDALRQLSEQSPSYFCLIIVDLFMPVLSGEEFISQCKQIFKDKLPHILVCSSNSDLPLIKKVAKEGICGYIIKPIDYKAFMDKIYDLFPDMKGSSGKPDSLF